MYQTEDLVVYHQTIEKVLSIPGALLLIASVPSLLLDSSLFCKALGFVLGIWLIIASPKYFFVLRDMSIKIILRNGRLIINQGNTPVEIEWKDLEIKEYPISLVTHFYDNSTKKRYYFFDSAKNMNILKMLLNESDMLNQSVQQTAKDADC